MNNWLTYLISTSPSDVDPDIEPIVETITEMRRQNPGDVMVIADAPYEELGYSRQPELEKKEGYSLDRLKERTERYDEYKRRLTEWCAGNDAQIMIFPVHTHRAGMTREALKFISTPCVMPLDHDSTTINVLHWANMKDAMQDSRVNLIRFYYFPKIHEAHKHLVDFPVQIIGGVPLLKTIQYGDTPNIHRTDFLRWMIEAYVGAKDKMFLEEVMCPIVYREGFEGQLFVFKLWIYAPENMECKTHRNVRGNLPMAMPVIYE